MTRKLIFIAPLGILAMLLFAVTSGEIVLYLWNRLLPPLFGWRQISSWQALGLLILCRVLFGRFGWRGSGRSRFRHIKERCSHTTPEGRERFRQRVRDRFGFGPTTCEIKGQ